MNVLVLRRRVLSIAVVAVAVGAVLVGESSAQAGEVIRVRLGMGYGGSRRFSPDFRLFSQKQKARVYFTNVVQTRDRDKVTARIWAHKEPDVNLSKIKLNPGSGGGPKSQLGKVLLDNLTNDEFHDKGIDKPRSRRFGHGDTITIDRKSTTPGERGNYVGELKFPGGAEAFFRRNPNAELWIELLD